MSKKSKEDIKYELEKEISNLKNFAVRKYREFLKTGENYNVDDFKIFLEEPLSCIKKKFLFIKEDDIVKDIVHYLGAQKRIRTVNGKSFMKFVNSIKDFEQGQVYDVKLRLKSGRKVKIETGMVIKSQQYHLISYSSSKKSFGAGTKVI